VARAEPDIVVVVPAHRAEGTIEACIAGLRAQDLDAERFEVHVVDTGEDAAGELVARLATGWDGRLHYHQVPGTGPGEKRNLGAAEAGAAHLAFTDADCVPDPSWLRAGLTAIEGGADLVQGPTLPPDGTAAGAFAHSIEITGPSPLFESCNVAYSNRAFRSAGGFPTEPFDAIGVPFGEDTELAWHVLRDGGRAVFAPEASVRHLVLPRSFGEHLRYEWQARHFAGLLGRVPELRREALTLNLFLGERSVGFDAALAGVLLARRTPLSLLLAVPYLRRLLRVSGGDPRTAIRRIGKHVIADCVRVGALAWGSLRSRRPVL